MDKRREADAVVSCLGQALLDGKHGLQSVPGLILRIINEDLWQDRIITQTGEPAHFDRFIDFVTTSPLEGLGATLPMLRRMCADTPAALDALDRVTKGRQGERTDLFNNVQDVTEAPVGNTAAAALRRLRKDAPALHARVLAGELSPHAAAIEAGFRKRTMQLPADVDGMAAALRRRLSDDELTKLAERLVNYVSS